MLEAQILCSRVAFTSPLESAGKWPNTPMRIVRTRHARERQAKRRKLRVLVGAAWGCSIETTRRDARERFTVNQGLAVKVDCGQS